MKLVLVFLLPFLFVFLLSFYSVSLFFGIPSKYDVSVGIINSSYDCIIDTAHSQLILEELHQDDYKLHKDRNTTQLPRYRTSCIGSCGESNSAEFTKESCQCDYMCTEEKDCCSDYKTECKYLLKRSPSSCANVCGQSHSDEFDHSDDCHCDFICEKNNDCCGDFFEMCKIDESFLCTHLYAILSNPTRTLLDYDPRVVFFLVQHPLHCNGKAAQIAGAFFTDALKEATSENIKSLNKPNIHDVQNSSTFREYMYSNWYAPSMQDIEPWTRFESNDHVNGMPLSSRSDLRENIWLATPKNLVDGIFAPCTIGPHSALQATLFAILVAETQEHDMSVANNILSGQIRPVMDVKNHPRVWLRLVESVGLPAVPHISTIEFLNTFPKDTFWNAALAVCVPRVISPETEIQIAGFSLYFEFLSTPGSNKLAREYSVRGIG